MNVAKKLTVPWRTSQ